MLHNVLNRRLDEVSRREEGPFYGALMGCEQLTRRCEAHCLEVVAYDRRICEGIEAALTEIARLRVHGIADVRPNCAMPPCRLRAALHLCADNDAQRYVAAGHAVAAMLAALLHTQRQLRGVPLRPLRCFALTASWRVA